MQKQLEDTALALRKHPASVLSSFQRILSRPTYFLALPESRSWTVLLGPRPRKSVDIIPFPPTDTATPEGAAAAAAAGRVYEFVAPQPTLAARMRRACVSSLRGFQAWLMHPVIDTRETP